MPTRLRGLIAVAVFAALLVSLNHGALRFLASNPGVFHAGDSAQAALWAIVQVAFAAALLLGARSLGRRLLAPAVGSLESPPWRPLLELALGLAAVSSGLFLAGLLGLFRAGVLRALALSLCCLGVAEAPGLIPRGPRQGLPDVWAAAAAGFLAYLVWNSLIRGLAPPIDTDVLKYHLALPKLFLRFGRIEAIPWLTFSHAPQLVEMPYSLALAFHSEAAAALIHAGLCAALVALTYAVARGEWGRPVALASCCLLAAQPVLYNQAGLALNDGALALFYLLSCACLWHWRVTGQPRWLKPAGMMAGCAAAVKYHGLMLLLGLAAWPLFIRPKHDGGKDAATFLGFAALFAVPWYLKTWILSGNPVWPFLSGLFGGNWGAASVAAWLSPGLSGVGFGPWVLFGEGAVYLLVPAVLALGSAWLRGERPSPLWALMLLPAPVYILRFAASASIWRYLLPFYPMLAMLAGWGAVRGLAAGGPARVVGVLALTIGLSGAARATHNNELFPVLGVRSRERPELSAREAYLYRALPGYGFMRAIHERVGAGGRVLLVADNRGYYLDVDYMNGDPPEQGVIDYASAAGPEELRRRLDDWGITHMAVAREDDWYGATLRRLAPRSYALLETTARRYGSEVARVGSSSLYALRASR